MANTIDSALVGDRIADAAVTVLTSRLAPLNSFTRDFGTDPLKPRATVQVPVASAGASTQTNPTNFETGNSTIDKASVTVTHYAQTFHLSAQEVNQGHKIEHLAGINARALANAIIDAALTPVTTANFGAAVVTDSSTNFDASDLKTLWGALEGAEVRNVVLDGAYFAQFLPTNRESFVPGAGAYGFDGFYLNSRWDGAGTNVVGFACDPRAIAIASGLPASTEIVRGDLLESRQIAIVDLGLTVEMNLWTSRATRALWASYEVMFGAAKADGSALKIVASA